MYNAFHMLQAYKGMQDEIDFLEVAFHEFLDRAYNAVEVNGNKLTIPSEKPDELIRLYLAVKELDEMEDEYNKLIGNMNRAVDSFHNLANQLEQLEQKYSKINGWEG